MTPAEIEPASFRLVAQHLNHCATAVPALLHCLSLHPAESTDWIPIKQAHSIQVSPYRSMPCVDRSYHF